MCMQFRFMCNAEACKPIATPQLVRFMLCRITASRRGLIPPSGLSAKRFRVRILGNFLRRHRRKATPSRLAYEQGKSQSATVLILRKWLKALPQQGYWAITDAFPPATEHRSTIQDNGNGEPVAWVDKSKSIILLAKIRQPAALIPSPPLLFYLIFFVSQHNN